MRLEQWEEGVGSFRRCVQQEGDTAEAWGNIGAIKMKQREYASALDPLEEAHKLKKGVCFAICLVTRMLVRGLSHMNHSIKPYSFILASIRRFLFLSCVSP